MWNENKRDIYVCPECESDTIVELEAKDFQAKFKCLKEIGGCGSDFKEPVRMHHDSEKGVWVRVKERVVG